ncbi:MAG: arginase family protein [Acidimicrobiales bacterium]
MAGSLNGQLLDAGLNGRHVVQVGLADLSNSAFHARRARDAGITVITRDKLRSVSVEESVSRALAVAGAGVLLFYVDIDLDATDRPVVPGCPAAAPGGLSADEMRRFVRAVTSSTRVRSIDFTEIHVQCYSDDQRPVRLAAHLVLEALAGVRRRQA